MIHPPPDPEVVPIFPLTGALLLPGGRLPLHVFEPRYRNMVEDCLAGDRVIGMIQPIEPTDLRAAPLAGPVADVLNDTLSAEAVPDRLSAGGRAGERVDDAAEEALCPELYGVGCNGWIESWEPLEGGRFLILLKGLRRFRVRQELPLLRGYRRLRVDYRGFDHDPAEVDADLSTTRLIEALQTFTRGRSLAIEIGRLSQLPGLMLLNSMAMMLPFAPAEKQALLEAQNVDERHDLLLTLLGMGIELHGAPTHTPN